jgi:hypothetical protein
VLVPLELCVWTRTLKLALSACECVRSCRGTNGQEVEVRLAVGAAGRMLTAEDRVGIKVLPCALDGGRNRGDEGASDASLANARDAQG